jgi:hypothetical protein
MVIKGNIEIQALLDLQLVVLAVENENHKMVLSTYQKKGRGIYRVTAGKMQIDAKISGQDYCLDPPCEVTTYWPNWTMDGASAEIEINNGDCQTLVGLLNLRRGLLDVNNDFCWEGTFNLHGGSPGSDLVIDVASGKSFGAGSCP